MKEKIIFLAQTYAPNPSECTYWIDLKEDPTGAIIKVWNGATWKPISGDTEVVAMLQEEIKKKATKATTLSGSIDVNGFLPKNSPTCSRT